MTDERHDIICLSSQSWDDGMWTNKQHIMSRLAQRHRVIHVDYGVRPFVQYAYRRLKQKPSDILSPIDFVTDGVQHREGGLHVADSYNPIWAGLFPYGSLVRDFASFDLKTLFLKRYLKKGGITDPIVWVYHPGYADAVDRLPRKLLIYDCVDNYEAFPNYREHRDWVEEKERTLCQKADLVFTTSQELYDLKSPYNPEDTHLVHNVGDAEHFKAALDDDTPVAADIADLEGPVIGFVGAVSDYKLNADWLVEVAKRHPEWHVVVVGPVGRADPGTDTSRLKAEENVHLMGLRDYDVLPTYLKRFDVAVIPYRINDATRSVFPIKFFEFMASGTPTVISNLPALEDFYECVQVAETPDAFVAECEKALAGDTPVSRDERVAVAERNSWESRINTIMGHVDEKLGG
jgi:glycosyltransferase involved in cell wall biosynthesis